MKNLEKPEDGAEIGLPRKGEPCPASGVTTTALAEQGNPQPPARRSQTRFDKPFSRAPDSVENTETINVGHLLANDITETGSFDIWGGIWATTFGKVMQALPIPAFLLDGDAEVIVANRACRRISTDYESFRHKSFLGLVPDPATAKKIAETLQQVFGTRRSAVTEIVLGTGRRKIWGRLTFRSIRIENSRFILALLEDLTAAKVQLHRNESLRKDLERLVELRTEALSHVNESLQCLIAERRRAEEEIVERERFLSDVFACIQDGISILDNELNIVRVNPAMERWYAHRMPVQGKKCYDAFHGRPEPCETCPSRHTLATGQPSCETVPLSGPDDETAGWLDLHTFPILDSVTGKLQGVIEYMRDVTDRRRLEDQLAQAAKMEAIGRLAGGIAHDFNNLLTVITGYCNLLALEIPKDHSQYQKVNSITRAAESATELTRKLLAYSRRQVLDVKTLDLNWLIRDLEEMLHRLIGENITLVTSLGSEDARIKADPSQMEQVLLNMAVNARDAMPEGGELAIETANISLDEAYARIHPGVQSGPYVMVAISDSGHGMDAETCSRVFDPFFTTKDKGVGTGLGLSTVYGIVKQHGGHVAVCSDTGRGTTFRVYFPLACEEAELVAVDVRPLSRMGGNETILVVEDDEPVRRVTCEALQMLGYTPLCAACPEDAIALARSHPGPIGMLLSDVVLPQMDGRRLFETIAPIRPEMKVLYVSGYTDNFIVHHGVLERGVHFLPKPLSLDALARKLREVLDGE